ncbi:MAG: SEC-C domain-containing protein [Desulfohalobiaceae bacterium]|nr:SEC-C domain-containing protein [Desulfohalobiaceae bacterium]
MNNIKNRSARPWLVLCFLIPVPGRCSIFSVDYELTDYLYQGISSVCGREWFQESSEDRELEDAEAEAHGFFWDLPYDRVERYLSSDFLQSWQEDPEKRLGLCLEPARTLRTRVLGLSGETQSQAPVLVDDVGRLRRMDSLLYMIADFAGHRFIDPDIAEMSALALLVLLTAGQTCWGRTHADISKKERLLILAEDRPGMIQDWPFAFFLKETAEKCDSDFRDALLQLSESALEEYNSAWARRILDLAPAFDLVELIPRLLETYRIIESGEDDGSIAFVEKILTSFHSPLLWPEYARQTGLGKTADPESVQASSFAWQHLAFTFLFLQKNPCPEASDWMEANFDSLLQENEVELFEAVLSSADQRFIPYLESLLAEEEAGRKSIFQTLCCLHADPRALGSDVEQNLWEEEENRHQEALDFTKQTLMDDDQVWARLAEKRQSLQLRCDKCQGVYNYIPERVIVYPGLDEGGKIEVDIGGEIACKACRATGEHLLLTRAGQQQLNAAMLPRLRNMSGLFSDVETISQDRPSSQQILIYPQKQAILGQEVRTMKEGLELYAQQLASDARSPKLLVGRANLLKRLLRLREARQGYLDALEADPVCLDAMLSLGELDTRQDRGDEAWQWLQKAYQVHSTGTVFHADPDTLRRHIVEMYAQEAPRHGQAPVEAKWNRKHRTRRNDPCPCGSGKKYKKCCLNRY